jgi:hypothetical protein
MTNLTTAQQNYIEISYTKLQPNPSSLIGSKGRTFFPGRRSCYSHLFGNSFKLFLYKISREADRRFIRWYEATMRQTEGRRTDGRGLHIRLELKFVTSFQFRSRGRFKILICAAVGRCRGDQLIQTYYGPNVCVYSCEQSHLDCTFHREMMFIGDRGKVQPRKGHKVPDRV